ncbi:cyclase family protein [Candidimonas nitroreducens]|uniref:Cyclase n=1 Tax=Candidimonas nitroreducens TaxID=683354 RepID=A0A225MKH5_9BURK|nr:cyclase family protein [Candidimonas nitroreducens]OWT61744.1 cyclase [Candidimonas nitroreducens]
MDDKPGSGIENAGRRWKRRPPGSNWGDFGADDQLGRMNLLTPEKVRQGLAEAREGKVFCLSLPLDFPGGSTVNPRRRPPLLQPTLRDGKPNINFPLSRLHCCHTDVISDDAVLLHTQYSTQWDGLAHVGAWFDANGDGRPEMMYYNGYRARADILGPMDYSAQDETEIEGRPIGAKKLGIENMASTCVQGRGVMIDLAAHFDTQRHYVSYDELMRIMEADGVEVERGDMVCLRTGFDRYLLDCGRNPPARAQMDAIQVGLDGRDERLLQWITDSGLAALISDNIGVELFPARPVSGHAPGHPLHQHCLFKLGIHLGELWLLSDLADWLRSAGRSRFLLTAPPLRLPGAIGSPATPVATV